MIRGLRRLGRRNVMLAAVSAFVTTAVLLGGGSAWAYWTTSSTAGVTMGAGTLAITTSNFTSIGTTFYNDNLVPAQTGSVTVTNTTATPNTTALPVTVAFPANSGALAGVITATIWPASNASNCTAAATVGTGSKTALWSAGLTMTPVSLATGSSVIYCVRSTATSTQSLATTAGSVSFTPTVTATETAGTGGTFTATATSSTSIGTTAIYPATTVPTVSWWFVHPVSSPNNCMDDANTWTASGTPDISWNCKNDTTDSNQQWQFSSVSGGYYQITNRFAIGLHVDANVTTSGANVTLNTASSATTQNWQPQLVSGTAAQASAGSATYQFVSQNAGYCLTVGVQDSSGFVNMIQSRCTGASNQQFFLSLAQFRNFTCSTSTSTPYTAQYSWSNYMSGANNGPYKFTTTVGGVSKTFASAPTDSGSITITGNETGTGIYSLNSAPAGSYPVTVTDAGGSTVATTTIVVNKGAGGAANGVSCT